MAEQEQNQPAIKCAIVVGMREDGTVFLETHGTEQNLIIIDGLLDYGKDYVDERWAEAKAAKAVPAQVTEPNPEPETKPKRKAPARKKKEATEDAED